MSESRNSRDTETIDGVLITPLKIIDVPGGNVLHAMKKSSPGFSRFGEAYFSTVDQGVIKAWKRHQEITINLIVPVGVVRFVIYDDRPDSPTVNLFQEVVLSRDNYSRLTVPSMLWMGFQGVVNGTSMLMNITDIEHQFEEADRLPLNGIKYDWEI